MADFDWKRLAAHQEVALKDRTLQQIRDTIEDFSLSPQLKIALIDRLLRVAGYDEQEAGLRKQE